MVKVSMSKSFHKDEDGLLDYFALLDIAPSFDIDVEDLQDHYLELSRQCHPDQYVGDSQAQAQAMQQMMDINEAFETLKLPLLRAQYLLNKEGIRVNVDQANVKPGQEILMETMEAREQLMQASTLPQLEDLLVLANKKVAEILCDMSQAFTDNALQDAAQHTIRLQYITKFKDEIVLKKRELQ